VDGEALAISSVAEEDVLRANTYSFLARLLARPLDAAALEAAAALRGDGSEFGSALGELGTAARSTSLDAVDQEFRDLFEAVGEPELAPYASYYLTGFLYEEPLARVRQDMASLGIARADAVSEPEDHIASLFEMMYGIIVGAFGTPEPLSRQRAFFDEHIGSWAGRFFADLEASPSSDFYCPVGKAGRIFLEIERQAFEMAA
jgi:TorA maturation chaperone TorD